MIPSVLLPSSVLTLGVTPSPLLFQQDTCDCAPIRMGLEKGGERGEDQICLRPQTISKADPAAYRRKSLTQLQIHSSAAPARAPVAFLCYNTRVQRPPERCRQGGMRPGTQTLRHPDPPIDHRSANRTQSSCSRRPDGTKKPRPSVPVTHTQPRPYTPMLLPHWSHSWAA